MDTILIKNRQSISSCKRVNITCFNYCKTAIAKGAVTMEGSHHSHGAPLGDEEIAKSKAKAGFDPEQKILCTC